MHKRRRVSSLFTGIDQSLLIALLSLLLLATQISSRGAIYELYASSCRRAGLPTILVIVGRLFVMGRNYRSSLHGKILVCFLLLVTMASWELKVYHELWPRACIVSSAAVPHDVKWRHHGAGPVPCIDLIIPGTWHGSLLAAQRSARKYATSCQHVPISKVTAALSMCNGNRPCHQVGELGIGALRWLGDGSRWLRFCGQSLPTVIDHGREVPLLILCIEVVIGLAQNSCLLD